MPLGLPEEDLPFRKLPLSAKGCPFKKCKLEIITRTRYTIYLSFWFGWGGYFPNNFGKNCEARGLFRQKMVYKNGMMVAEKKRVINRWNCLEYSINYVNVQIFVAWRLILKLTASYLCLLGEIANSDPCISSFRILNKSYSVTNGICLVADGSSTTNSLYSNANFYRIWAFDEWDWPKCFKQGSCPLFLCMAAGFKESPYHVF